jgi:transketolase
MHIDQKIEVDEFENISRRVRKNILSLVYRTKGPHLGSSFSCVEILVSLYLRFLNVSSMNPQDQERDRFIFSKGHASPALYAVLHECGFLTEDDLDGFAANGGLLEQHPNKNGAKGIEVSTGSLGHGLSIGAGMALAAKRNGERHRVCVLVSDGELNEGSIWEAMLFSAHHRLDNLLLVVDYNKMQALGFTKDTLELDPLRAKCEAFGWACVEIDGHHFPDLFGALGRVPFQADKPGIIIAHTIKGKGVSFMENSLYWHYSCPNDEEYRLPLDDLSRNMI